jgi:hypothetical protein
MPVCPPPQSQDTTTTDITVVLHEFAKFHLILQNAMYIIISQLVVAG